ncbi:MAG: methyltransferase [Desulfobacterales bacterium RIFOXYA12_FULL_46_15]|nr:MAG: methyltransferase [Desulfobacula sp. GWF2_41_7]OGR23153.1 MAG: methyltransferase [Desulfobacterales bacterium RIFOXYA12_FULL_46_15]
MTDLSEITKALISGNTEQVCSLVKAEVTKGTNAGDILNIGLIQGMDIVGERMQSGDMFIPEVLMSAKTMSAAVEILKPLLSADDMSSAGHIVIGTVKGDLHDIGKNLVSMMVESSGFEVTDLGVDVAPEAFVKAIQEKNANIVALSALLTTTMPMMQQTMNALVESGLRDKVKVIVGGAPVNQDFADKIGADGYAPDAGSASKLAKELWA